MVRDCLWAPYEQTRINAATGTTVARGVLFKITWPGIGIGYSDLMPFCDHGDPPTAELVRLAREAPGEEIAHEGHRLREHGVMDLRELLIAQTKVLSLVPSRIVGVSLFHNLVDAIVRARGESCFAGLSVPASHRLVDSLAVRSLGELHAMLAESAARGFPAVKIKAMGSLDEKLSLLQLVCSLEDSPLPIRIDCNAALTASDLRQVVENKKGNSAWRYVEFIEDPCAYDSAEWRWLRERGVPLASDFVCEGPCEEAVVSVVKPARGAMKPYLESDARLCVTHCMDHALGRSVAAWWAALLARDIPTRMTTPGLVSGSDSPRWSGPENGDVGFGCTAELAEAGWSAR